MGSDEVDEGLFGVLAEDRFISAWRPRVGTAETMAIEYGRQRYLAVDFSFSTRFSRYRSRRGGMDLSKARCMQSAQGVLFVVRRGTTWLFRVTWSFSRWDVDAVAHQHAIARAKDPCLSLRQVH